MGALIFFRRPAAALCLAVVTGWLLACGDAAGRAVTHPADSRSDSPPLAFFLNVFTGQMGAAPRLLQRVYHPENFYVTHLDAKARGTSSERQYEAMLKSARSTGAVDNLVDLAPSRRVAYDGVSMVDVTLSAITVLLGMGQWSYFINLMPYDYPLLPQPEMRAALGALPHDLGLSFVSHTNGAWSEAGRWWASSRLPAVVLDTSIYMAAGDGVRSAGNTTDDVVREMPTAFDVFRGDPWVILGRLFAEYLVLGTDGWARRALLYLANMPSPIEHYFPTVLCNSPAFRPLVVRDSLRVSVADRFYSSENPQFDDKDMRDLLLDGHLFAVLPNHMGKVSYAAMDAHLEAVARGEMAFSDDADGVEGGAVPYLSRVMQRLEFVLANNNTCEYV